MLTFALYWTILVITPRQHVLEYSWYMRRFRTRKNNGVGDYTMCESLFLCPKSFLSILKNSSLWWGGLLEQLRYAAFETNMKSRRPKIRTFAGGLQRNNGVATMLNHAQSATRTEIQLIDLSQIIGSIAGRNAMFTSGLSRYINDLGKPLPELTVSELAELTDQYCEAFNYGIEPSIKKVTVSPTKAKSLQKQHESIGHALSIFCLEHNEINRACLKSDALELVRMLDDLPVIPHKTSRFNVLSKSKRLIAKHVTYEQAMQYQNVSLKFAGMEYSS